MPDQLPPGNADFPPWAPGLTRVPYWVFQRDDVARAEQARVFGGESWNFLGLTADVPNPNDFRTSWAGETPVILVRDGQGELRAFENRCAHRGALLAYENAGNAKDFTCVYHGWMHDQCGNLSAVAFSKGVRGQGGMSKDFRMQDHGPRKMRVATLCGLVFGTFSDRTMPLEDYLGPDIVAGVNRVFLGRTPKVLARFTQALPNNWKLYAENTRDTYHASILHSFFTTFQLNRLGMKGGVVVNEAGGCHISWSSTGRSAAKDDDYSAQGLRSETGMRLADPRLLRGFDEFPDGTTLQILSVFPGFILQHIQNALAVRQIVPRGPEKTDLHWTYFGFEEDTPEQKQIRLTQANLMGPAGLISMEDGCVGGFVRRGTATAEMEDELLEMGGAEASSTDSRASEASIRGFWKAYRSSMGI